MGLYNESWMEKKQQSLKCSQQQKWAIVRLSIPCECSMFCDICVMQTSQYIYIYIYSCNKGELCLICISVNIESSSSTNNFCTIKQLKWKHETLHHLWCWLNFLNFIRIWKLNLHLEIVYKSKISFRSWHLGEWNWENGSHL